MSGLPDQCSVDRGRCDVERRTDRSWDEQVLQKEKNKPEENKMKLKEMEPETEVNEINNPRIIGGAGHAKLL